MILHTSILAATVLAHVITLEPAEPLEDAAVKYETACAGKSTPECKKLQWRLEYALYEDLSVLVQEGPLDEEMVQAGLKAECPQLKALALEEVLHRGMKPAEHPYVIAALNDPYPLVRWTARQMVGQLPDEKYSRMLLREANSSSRPRSVTGIITRPQPDAKALGAAPYPGSTYWYFASGEDDGDFFTTMDPVEKVLAHFTKGGKKPQTAAELAAKIEAAKGALEKDPMLLMKLMQEAMANGQDPAKVMESISKGGPNTSQNWGSGLESEGIIKPRFVVLEETPFLGKPLPEKVVAVFKDEVMGGTAVVFRRVKPRPAMPKAEDQQDMESWQRAMQTLSQPDAQIEN